MDVGITGTRYGPTEPQGTSLAGVLTLLAWTKGIDALRHGDCKGVDEVGFQVAKLEGVLTIAHPPTDPEWRAFTDSDIILDPDEYLVRDRAIVAESDLLIAAPRQKVEERRSGTWATVRYARARPIPILYVWPDGLIELSMPMEVQGALPLSDPI